MDFTELRMITVAKENSEIFHRLLQCYEAEFSKITKKIPNEDGLFPLDIQLGGSIFGLILFCKNQPIGVAAVESKTSNIYEGKEFYVVPSFRRLGVGAQFAYLLFSTYPGEWEIKQIDGATDAVRFWRKTLSLANMPLTDLKEDIFHDPYWGLVTRQRFNSTQK